MDPKQSGRDFETGQKGGDVEPQVGVIQDAKSDVEAALGELRIANDAVEVDDEVHKDTGAETLDTPLRSSVLSADILTPHLNTAGEHIQTLIHNENHSTAPTGTPAEHETPNLVFGSDTTSVLGSAEAPNIEVDLDAQHNHDENFSDSDSAIGMPESSTVSLRESVFEYVEENGRTYHAFHAGKYIGPNDEIEQERLDLQHHLFVMTMDNKLHLAPLKNPQNVLDIATGTGIWAIQFAQQYPSARVLGTDLSPIQPSFVPQNCTFEIDDAEEEWVYAQPFDYIHGRALLSCFSNPPSVIAKIFEHLAPGGYFEFQDPIMPLKSIDGSLAGTALDEFQTSSMAAAASLGRPWTNGKNYGRWMRKAGFEDIVEKSYFWATNQWVKGKDKKLQALWLQENLQEGLPAWGLSTLSRGFGWSREKIDDLLARAREDLRNTDIHAYAECYVVYGRKPELPVA